MASLPLDDQDIQREIRIPFEAGEEILLGPTDLHVADGFARDGRGDHHDQRMAAAKDSECEGRLSDGRAAVGRGEDPGTSGVRSDVDGELGSGWRGEFSAGKTSEVTQPY
jgi:hypothetical protein